MMPENGDLKLGKLNKNSEVDMSYKYEKYERAFDWNLSDLEHSKITVGEYEKKFDEIVDTIKADERVRAIEELFDKCVDTVDMDSNYLYVKVNRENFNIPQIPLRSLLKKWVIEQLISRG